MVLGRTTIPGFFAADKPDETSLLEDSLPYACDDSEVDAELRTDVNASGRLTYNDNRENLLPHRFSERARKVL